MKNIEEVVRYIEEEISKAADAECATILAEVNEAKAKAEEELYSEAQKDASLQLQSELAQLKADAAVEISKSNSETTKKLIAKREEYTRLVFDEVLTRLSSFTQGNEYVDYLNKKVKKVSEACALDGVVFYIRKDDEKLADMLKKAYGHECRVEVDEAIRLGGFIFENSNLGLVFDETIDAALNDQREWFANHSGLIIQ